MKRISTFFLATALLAAPAVLRAQDAALEERLNKLTAAIQDLKDASELQNKKIEALAKQIEAVQQQQNKPTGNYASQEDLKQLAAGVKEIDQKRQKDSAMVAEKLDNLIKSINKGPSSTSSLRANPTNTGSTEPARPEHGFPYEVKDGDTLIAIAKAYNDKGVKVTVKQILDANPGLKPETLKPGKTIFIPGVLP